MLSTARQSALGLPVDHPSAKKSFTVYSPAFASQLALKDYTWTVDLLDRKRNSLLAAPLDLGPEQLDSCPAVGVPILQYTAP